MLVEHRRTADRELPALARAVTCPYRQCHASDEMRKAMHASVSIRQRVPAGAFEESALKPAHALGGLSCEEEQRIRAGLPWPQPAVLLGIYRLHLTGRWQDLPNRGTSVLGRGRRLAAQSLCQVSAWMAGSPHAEGGG